uniref:Transcriptional regulator n=1 Tax=Emericellopsis sp. TaxID=88752 RepID=A0AA96NNX7_9HYPO|nr:putative transcriptional regulator [Emericellopsis sp.]
MALDAQRYTIAWIAPLPIEARAAVCLLDRKHSGTFPMQRGDDYVFQAGDVCGHNVVIATLPAGQEYGTGSAAALASQVKKYFPNLWFGLLVGVAAGLPKLTEPSPRDIRLGDVLVALPDGDSAGLVAYDLGKETADGFQLLKGGHVLAVTETVVRAAIGNIRLQAPDDIGIMLPYYEQVKDKEHSSGTFADPGQDADKLYLSDDTGRSILQSRPRRPDHRRARIWYGPIGSGEKLMKNAAKRDTLRDRYSLIGLEMEAAGTMNRIPVGVIRGVCDYGDEHKNKEWQPYAAAMAGAYAKAVLAQIGPRRPNSVCLIPFRQNQDFIGRTEQLDQLQRMLFTDNRERVAIVGLGGMGKTQIALELAYRVQEKRVDDTTERYSVIWMPAQSMVAFHKAASEVVRKLGIQCGGSDDPKEVLREYLTSEAAGHWFLVVDNADDVASLNSVSGESAGLYQYLPRSRTGRLLVTTRLTMVAEDVAVGGIVELSAMTFKEAHLFLETSLRNKAQLEDAESTARLVEKLIRFPLALAQAAAYMNQKKTPIYRYLKMLESADQNMIDLLSRRLRDETHHSETQGAVATTWVVSFNAIREADAGAVRLLSFIQWIESEAIPVTKAIEVLEHVVAIRKETLAETHPSRLASEHALAMAYRANGQVTKAIEVLEHVVAIKQEILAETHPDRLASQHALAMAYRANGQVTKAIEVLEYVVAIEQEILAETHPDRLASEHGLAIAYRANGQVTKAIEVLEHVVAIRKEILAETHPGRLASEHALAIAYRANGQVTKAIKVLEYVLAIRKEILAETHPSRLASEHVLAMAYRANGQVTKAIEVLEHVVAIKQEILAETHPDRLASQHALAMAYQDNGQVTKAIEVLEHVVAIRKEILVETHPSRLASERGLEYLATTLVKR